MSLCDLVKRNTKEKTKTKTKFITSNMKKIHVPERVCVCGGVRVESMTINLEEENK